MNSLSASEIVFWARKVPAADGELLRFKTAKVATAPATARDPRISVVFISIRDIEVIKYYYNFKEKIFLL